MTANTVLCRVFHPDCQNLSTVWHTGSCCQGHQELSSIMDPSNSFLKTEGRTCCSAVLAAMAQPLFLWSGQQRGWELTVAFPIPTEKAYHKLWKNRYQSQMTPKTHEWRLFGVPITHLHFRTKQRSLPQLLPSRQDLFLSSGSSHEASSGPRAYKEGDLDKVSRFVNQKYCLRAAKTFW